MPNQAPFAWTPYFQPYRSVLSPSLQLGIPTANIPADDLSKTHPELTTGVYYGVVALDPKDFAHEHGLTGDTEKARGAIVQPAVLSIGYNPYYKNTVRSVVSSSFALTLAPLM